MTRPTLNRKHRTRETPIPEDFASRYMDANELITTVFRETGYILRPTTITNAMKKPDCSRYFKLSGRMIFYREEALEFFLKLYRRNAA
jgi:hypothetical protein